MVPLRSFFQLALTTLSLGAVLPRQVQPPFYDAIIVGGGPSGLAALSGLARVRRNVLLIDSGEYRNAKTRHMHDVLGFDGVTPAYFRWAAREKISHYDTVSYMNGTVEDIQPSGDSSAPVFTVTSTHPDPSGNSTVLTTHVARRLILATGVRDMLPDTPGIAENWGRGLFWCPWCDGREHADQPLGLLASLPSVPGLVREMQTLNKDVVAFLNGTDTAAARAAATLGEGGADWEAYLRLLGVRLDNRTVAALVRLDDGAGADADPGLPSVPERDRFRVDFAEGAPVERAAFLASFGKEQRSSVGERLGVALRGGRLLANQSAGLLTNVPGVWAVGDANTDNSTNVPHALWSGKRAAVSLHVDLVEEDAKELLAGGIAKRKADLDSRSVWEVMNGEPDDVLYAVKFEQ